jgi:hypothetical protein
MLKGQFMTFTLIIIDLQTSNVSNWRFIFFSSWQTNIGGGNMAGRGTSNSPNTRNPERPHSKPSRLDQFGDMMFGNDDKAFGAGVTSRKEKKSYK